MKYVAIAAALFIVTILAAQGHFSIASPTGPLSTCPVPARGSNALCSGPDSWYISRNGAPYVKL